MKRICLGPSLLGADKGNQDLEGRSRNEERRPQSLCGLGQGPPLRLCPDSLLRVGHINPKRSSLPMGIAGQPGRPPLLLRLKQEKRWSWHHITGRSLAPL